MSEEIQVKAPGIAPALGQVLDRLKRALRKVANKVESNEIKIEALEAKVDGLIDLLSVPDKAADEKPKKAAAKKNE